MHLPLGNMRYMAVKNPDQYFINISLLFFLKGKNLQQISKDCLYYLLSLDSFIEF